MPRFAVFTLCAALSAASVVVAQQATATAPATTAPASRPVDARWQSLLQRLADEDFQKRDAAQKDLDQTTWRDLALLRQLAGEAADAEVKSSLLNRVRVLEEGLATNPPPISLSLKGASQAEVAQALSKALGMDLEVWPPRSNGNFNYTLDATDMPFWEVFFALSRQQPMRFQDMGNRTSLYFQGGWKNATISGPLAIIPGDITRTRRVLFQDDVERPPESMQMTCTFALDPRIKVIQYGSPRFSKIVDDKDNNLAPPIDDDHLWTATSGFNQMARTQGVSLKIPDGLGTRIVSARGSVHYVVQVASSTVEVPKAETLAGQTVSFGDLKVVFNRLDVDAEKRSISYSIQVSNPGAPAQGLGGVRILNAAGGETETSPLVMTFVDASGKRLVENTMRAGSSLGGSTSGNSFLLPLTLRLSMTTKVKDLVVPFELKDMPLP